MQRYRNSISVHSSLLHLLLALSEMRSLPAVPVPSGDRRNSSTRSNVLPPTPSSDEYNVPSPRPVFEDEYNIPTASQDVYNTPFVQEDAYNTPVVQEDTYNVPVCVEESEYNVPSALMHEASSGQAPARF